MRGVSTFGAFTTARLGIYAAQKALDVTGHNITNINTTGYTRQRLDQMSLRLGGSDRYASGYDARVGSGVLCTGVSQLRDPYLDIRYRNELSSVGSMDSKLGGLEEISKILDEVGKGEGDGVLAKQFNDLVKQLQGLSASAGNTQLDSAVRSSADALVKLLNSYATRLNGVKDTQTKSFGQDLDTVNNLLKNIGSLNDKIFKSELHGDGALELKDERNLMLDELSRYAKINIKYEAVSVGAGSTVDKMIITLGGSPATGNGNDAVLVDGSFVTEFSTKIPLKNTDPNTQGAFPWLDEHGIMTNDETLARQDPVLNTDPATKDAQPYLDVDGNPTNDLTLAKKFSAPNPDPNTNQPRIYLDKDGNPTGDINAAKRVETENFDLVLKPLTNDNNQVLGGSAEVALGDQALYGSLQSTREMLTKDGEFSSATDIANDPKATTKRGIPYYQKSMDALATRFAEVMNGLNKPVYKQDTDGNYLDKDGAIISEWDSDGDPLTPNIPINKDTVLTDDIHAFLVSKGSRLYGGPLFSTSSDGNATSGINASNISISDDWSTGTVRIVNSYSAPGSDDNSNIREMIIQLDGKHDFYPSDGDKDAASTTPFSKGSFQGMFTDTCATLANDKRSTTTLLNNYASSATEIDISRSAISGVDLNDEAANMMQYQKSYSAACRLMTTLDEALDKLINGTGVVGR